METYIPTTTGGGILGGKGADGELDGIQAWKKGMKEKERKEKGETHADGGKAADTNGTSDKPASAAPSPNSETPMDEIQLFKMMMKREAEKKEGERVQNGLSNHASMDSGPPGLSASPSVQSQKSDTPTGTRHFLSNVTADPTCLLSSCHYWATRDGHLKIRTHSRARERETSTLPRHDVSSRSFTERARNHTYWRPRIIPPLGNFKSIT